MTVTTSNHKYTGNGAHGYKSTLSPHLDFFSNIISYRNNYAKGIEDFYKAYASDEEMALRLLLWTRDIRGGAGERRLFREILNNIVTRKSNNGLEMIKKVVQYIPEIGRFDDLTYLPKSLETLGVEVFAEALSKGNALAAKWAPRKGKYSSLLRKRFGLSHADYRKGIVALSKTIEQQMCKNDWGSINYSHVPSLASRKYIKAFLRNDEKRFRTFLGNVKKGIAKINASTLYPHDLYKDIFSSNSDVRDSVVAQWDALPNYIPDGVNILPVCDTSGSMTYHTVVNSLRPLNIATTLATYIAHKNTGLFKNVVMSFSDVPILYNLTGNPVEDVKGIEKHSINANTNIKAVYNAILDVAIKAKAKQEDLPEYIVFLSDMQFDRTKFKATPLKEAKELFNNHGYELPKICFWNINKDSSQAKPVNHAEWNTSYVSGFSPAILKFVLGNGNDPYSVMLEALYQERYNIF